MEGQGLMRYPDGKSYKGKFKDGKMHGLGVFTWPDNKVYSGCFKFNKMHGFGRLISNKTKYGAWENGKYKNAISESQYERYIKQKIEVTS